MGELDIENCHGFELGYTSEELWAVSLEDSSTTKTTPLIECQDAHTCENRKCDIVEVEVDTKGSDSAVVKIKFGKNADWESHTMDISDITENSPGIYITTGGTEFL